MSRRVAALAAVLVVTAGCAERDAPAPSADAAVEVDAGMQPDAAPLDAGSAADAGEDAGFSPDAGDVPDAGEDAGGPDAGGQDAGAIDDGGPDDGGPDGGGPTDAGTEDAGTDDAGAPDAGAPDAGIVIPDGGPAIPCETGGRTTELEPDDTPAQATRISSGQPVLGRIHYETDQDWYLLDACGESLLTVDLKIEGAEVQEADGGISPFGTLVDLRVDVLAADGTTLLNWQQDRMGEDGATSLRVIAYIERAGPIYLRVTDLGDDEEDPELNYELTASTSAVPDADFEPDGNQDPATSSALAHPLSEGVIASAYLASTRDEDWYRITVSGPTLVDVHLTDAPSTGTPLRYRLRMLAPNGVTELARADAPAAGAGSVNFKMTAQLPARGDYFVVVSDQTDQSDPTRPYQIFYQLRPVPDLNLEPNESAAEARPITEGTPIGAFISAPRDQDWYSIDVPSEKIIRARLTVPAGLRTPVDFEVTIYAPDGIRLIARTTDFDGQFGDIDVVALAYAGGSASPYYVSVADWRADDGDADRAYTLEVTLVDVPDADLEPNDIITDATPITSGQPVIAYLASYQDRDLYAVTIAAGQTINALLDAAATEVQYRVSILDQFAGLRLADNFDVNGMSLPNQVNAVIAPSQAGTYFVSVEDLGGDNADLGVPYTLVVTVSGP